MTSFFFSARCRQIWASSAYRYSTSSRISHVWQDLAYHFHYATTLLDHYRSSRSRRLTHIHIHIHIPTWRSTNQPLVVVVVWCGLEWYLYCSWWCLLSAPYYKPNGFIYPHPQSVTSSHHDQAMLSGQEHTITTIKVRRCFCCCVELECWLLLTTFFLSISYSSTPIIL